MFKRNLIPVWVGFMLLSSMLLMEQGDAWGQCSLDNNCGIWPAGYEYVVDGTEFIESESSEPMAPFEGKSVAYKGYDHSVCNPLVIRYKITYPEDTTVNSVSVTGVAWWDNAYVRFLDENKLLIDEEGPYGDGNTRHTIPMTFNDVIGRTFYLEIETSPANWFALEEIVLDPPCPCNTPYCQTANTMATSYGRASLRGSGIFNSVALVLLPMGAVIVLRIWRRKR